MVDMPSRYHNGKARYKGGDTNTERSPRRRQADRRLSRKPLRRGSTEPVTVPVNAVLTRYSVRTDTMQIVDSARTSLRLFSSSLGEVDAMF
jgi:hypothetical protein